MRDDARFALHSAGVSLSRLGEGRPLPSTRIACPKHLPTCLSVSSQNWATSGVIHTPNSVSLNSAAAHEQDFSGMDRPHSASLSWGSLTAYTANHLRGLAHGESKLVMTFCYPSRKISTNKQLTLSGADAPDKELSAKSITLHFPAQLPRRWI